jgi:hypothetical protein
MQRDLGNEVIVAIAAVGILAFAITFAIILSLSNTPDATATATLPSSNGAGTPIATTAAVDPSATNVEPTTETIIATSTSTDEIVATAQANDNTTIEATSAVPTAVEDRNQTVAPTKAGTVATSRPLVTATSSFTPEPSTATKTPTRTPPPPTVTRTPTKTPTPTPTLTRTPLATETSGIRPTAVGLATAEPLATQTTCVYPQGWVTYTVRQGDTLLSIARAVGSTLFELQTSNCLQDINSIYAGATILVPRLPAGGNNPIPGHPNPDSPVSPEGCTDPNSVITNLEPGQIVSGVFNVIGTANVPDFWYYKLEVRPDFATVYNFYNRSETAVSNGSLGQIDQGVFGVGLHWVKLTVIGKSSGATPCAIPLIFQ